MSITNMLGTRIEVQQHPANKQQHFVIILNEHSSECDSLNVTKTVPLKLLFFIKWHQQDDTGGQLQGDMNCTTALP